MNIETPASWKDYELLDSGYFEKLERFGDYVLIRPEPQAIWPRRLLPEEWVNLSTARFDREQKDKFRYVDDARGGWNRKKGMPESWTIDYQHQDWQMKLRLALTAFGHVGIFPEQASNWNFIRTCTKALNAPKPKILNLFAYTGAASVVATLAGAEVTHCDASRPGLNWASQNMQLNECSGTRWVHEDALKFVKREVKRGNRYHGVIMDPPPYGRGPSGEKWTLQEKLTELVAGAVKLLEPEGFFILSMYAAGLSPEVGMNVVKSYRQLDKIEYGEFHLCPQKGLHLPMGTFVRFKF